MTGERLGPPEPAEPAGDVPALSVVVVPFAGREYLARCLDALSRQAVGRAVEIIVPCDERLAGAAWLRGAYPRAEFVMLGGRRSPAALRSAGLHRARGAVVAVTEDHCTPEPSWCDSILRAHAAPHAAVGGVTEKAPGGGPMEWALYLCDYGRYMPPVPEGPARHLTDCNVSYKRAALAEVEEVWRGEFHETAVHDALRARGGSLWLSPAIVVRQGRRLPLAAALADRFAGGRLFARTRVADAPPSRRVLLAGASTLLPPVLLARAASHIARARRHRGALLRALPLAATLVTAWAAGELAGYLGAGASARGSTGGSTGGSTDDASTAAAAGGTDAPAPSGTRL